MYTAGLTDGWCNKAGQNSVTRNPSDVFNQRARRPTDGLEGRHLSESPLRCCAKSSAFRVKLFRFHLTSVTTRLYLLFYLTKCDVSAGSWESKDSAKGSFMRTQIRGGGDMLGGAQKD